MNPLPVRQVAQAIWDEARSLGIADAGAKFRGGLAGACTTLKERLAEAHRFNAMAATIMAAGYAGQEGLAREMAISRSAVGKNILAAGDAALGEGAGKTIASLSSAQAMAGFLAGLGRLARIELRKHFAAAGGKPLHFPDGRFGNRACCVAWLALIVGASKPVVRDQERCVRLPAVIAEVASPGAGAERLAALDARPAGWLALLGTAGRVLGVGSKETA
jgi:hypothetical protein